MKSTFAIFLIFSFVGVAVFGVFAMNHGDSHNGCLAKTAQKADCPKETGALPFLNFHLESFKNFSTATLTDNLANALLLLLALILATRLKFIANVQPTSPVFAANYHRRQFLESPSFPYQQKLTHWLALRKNSPAAS